MRPAPVRPKLPVSDANAAIEWYTRVFGATVLSRYEHEGVVVHCDLALFGGSIALKDGDEADPAPTKRGVIVEIDLDNPDELERAALEAGATSIYPVADQPYGARGGRFRDPYGHEWLIQTPMPDQS